MNSDVLTGSGLQSGFVLAVLIAAVLLAGHLGGTAGLVKRVAQVALGLVLAMVVLSATNAFHGPPVVPAAELEAALGSDMELLKGIDKSAERNSEVGTIHTGLGIIFVLLGVVMLGRLNVITPAFLLGGVLLVLFGAPAVGGTDSLNPLLSLLNSVVPGALGDAGTGREIAQFAVLVVGALALAGLMHWRWEDHSGNDAK